MYSQRRPNQFRFFARSAFARSTTSPLSSISLLLNAHPFVSYTGPRKSSQGGQDSNLQPTVLETVALPIAPPPSGGYPFMGTKNFGRSQLPRMIVREKHANCRTCYSLTVTVNVSGWMPPC